MNALVMGPTTYGAGGAVKFSRYISDRSSIAMTCGDMKLTVCLPEGSPNAGENCVWLKGWSENDGVPKALEDAGIVKLTGRTVPTGHVEAEHAELTPAAIEQFKREDPLHRMGG